MSAHKPATPLPWVVTPLAGGIEGANHIELARMAWPRRSIARQLVEGDEPRKRVEARIVSDAAYIAHAANAYPKLVEAMRKARAALIADGHRPGLSAPLVEVIDPLLAELGEAA